MVFRLFLRIFKKKNPEYLEEHISVIVTIIRRK